MIELLIAMTILLGGLTGYLRSIVSSMELGRTNGETAIAVAALQSALEDIAAEDFSDVFARYNGDDADDPGGVGTAPGPSFDVDGLSARPEDADGLVGEIDFPTPPGAGGTLAENPGTSFPGMPRDLNVDGDAADGNVNADHVLLPVRIRLRWRSASGHDRAIEGRTILLRR
ncbi:MAG: hypothetical protein GY711_18000 [bacterium]|nr:hypothetical protein [bacterium]